jgi:excisionase family DNA binding protein
MTSQPNPLSNLETLAARWGVSVRTLGRMVARGELKAHRIGSQLRFSDEDVTAYVRLRRG